MNSKQSKSQNFIVAYKQGIIDMNRNGNFCTGTWVSKVFAKTKVGAHVKQQKKFTGFSRMSVMANLLCFGCLLRDNR